MNPRPQVTLAIRLQRARAIVEPHQTIGDVGTGEPVMVENHNSVGALSKDEHRLYFAAWRFLQMHKDGHDLSDYLDNFEKNDGGALLRKVERAKTIVDPYWSIDPTYGPGTLNGLPYSGKMRRENTAAVRAMTREHRKLYINAGWFLQAYWGGCNMDEYNENFEDTAADAEPYEDPYA